MENDKEKLSNVIFFYKILLIAFFDRFFGHIWQQSVVTVNDSFPLLLSKVQNIIFSSSRFCNWLHLWFIVYSTLSLFSDQGFSSLLFFANRKQFFLGYLLSFFFSPDLRCRRGIAQPTVQVHSLAVFVYLWCCWKVTQRGAFFWVGCSECVWIAIETFPPYKINTLLLYTFLLSFKRW